MKEDSYAFARTMLKVPDYKLVIESLPEVYADSVVAWYTNEYDKGTVQFNTTKLLKNQYVSEQKSLWTHEILGHHFAYGHALENLWLNYFRADNDKDVDFDEDWALYMEDLRYQLDDYTPEEKIGYFKNKLWRAARLVVDTGLHTGKMTKAEAIRYFMDATFDNKTLATTEIERYMEWPAQSLTYMVGNWRFWEIRRRVESILGKRGFDPVKYHNKLLSSSAIPIDELEHVMLRWARRRKSQLRSLARKRAVAAKRKKTTQVRGQKKRKLKRRR